MTKVSNKQIRILQIGMHDQVGGVENFLLNYYKHIDRNRIQFDFINQYDKLCFEEKIQKMNGRIYKVTNVKKNPIKYYFELKRIYNQYKNFQQNKIVWEQKEAQRKSFRNEYDNWHRKEKELLLRQQELLHKAGINVSIQRVSSTSYR